jgi:hypothetical protein
VRSRDVERLEYAFVMPKGAVSPCTKPDMVNAQAQESWSVVALIGWAAVPGNWLETCLRALQAYTVNSIILSLTCSGAPTYIVHVKAKLI